MHAKVSLSLDVESMSEFAQLLWDRIIVHADDWGRLHGEPTVVKAQCKPLSPRPASDFDAALGEIARAGLIVRYEVEGKRYLQVVKWDEHQDGLHKRTESDFPEPPTTEDMDSGKFREVPGSSRLNETKRNEEKGREDACARETVHAQPQAPVDLFLAELAQVDGYPLDECKDRTLFDALAATHPAVDLAVEARNWRVYKLDRPLGPKDRPRSQLRSWVRIAAERLAEVRNGHDAARAGNGAGQRRVADMASPASVGYAPGDRPWLLSAEQEADIAARQAAGDCW